MTDKTPLRPQLWTERPVEETIAVYRDWANTYDQDVTARGYHTPARIAEALARALPAGDGPVLDFGCGTGMSGAALTAVGIGPLHGTDITAEMIAQAKRKDIYDRLWIGQPGEAPARPGTYRAIVATGVVSLGAAPPETLDILIDALAPGGLLAFSYNDPTLEDGRYDRQLDARLADGSVAMMSRDHGLHLDDMEMGSDVIVIRRL